MKHELGPLPPASHLDGPDWDPDPVYTADQMHAYATQEVAAAVAPLEAEIQALRKDAERYRWLRDVASAGDWGHIGQTTEPSNTDARVDECRDAYAAVDAAMERT